MTNRPRLLLALLILNALLLPLGCLPTALLLNTFNPMMIDFIRECHITNALSEPITVTPVGTIPGHDFRQSLLVYRYRRPAIPTFRSGGFRIEPGQTKTLFFDGADLSLSEIVVRRADGTTGQLTPETVPPTNQYRTSTSDRLTIEPTSPLAAVQPAVAAAAADAQRPNPFWPILVLMLLPWLTFYFLFKAYRRSKRDHANAAAT